MKQKPNIVVSKRRQMATVNVRLRIHSFQHLFLNYLLLTKKNKKSNMKCRRQSPRSVKKGYYNTRHQCKKFEHIEYI